MLAVLSTASSTVRNHCDMLAVASLAMLPKTHPSEKIYGGLKQAWKRISSYTQREMDL